MSKKSVSKENAMPQVAVITGDIVNSQDSNDSDKWLSVLTNYLSQFGESPQQWQVYRGDSFQLILPQPESALLVALGLKAVIKQCKPLDVRMGIGVGAMTHEAEQVLQSNGEAFVNSGRMFDSLKKRTLAVKTPWNDCDKTINLQIKLALLTMDDWSDTSAEVVAMSLRNPEATQKDIAEMLSIPQSRVSERLSRAGFDAILEMEHYYRETIVAKIYGH